MVKLMCVTVAQGIQIQCGHEYGFANKGKVACVTGLLKLEDL